MTVTHPEWNQETGGLQVAKAFADEIRGKNVLITGVSPSSIGSSIALSIASQSPGLLILASRTQSNLDQVVQTIKEAYPTTNTHTVFLDLMSQEAIARAAAIVSSTTNSLDVVINNAGLMTPERHWTPEGIEAQFGTSHIGHFLLTNLLLPLLLTSSSRPSTAPGSTRIINLTSLGHKISPVHFDDYNLTGRLTSDNSAAQLLPLPPMFAHTTPDGYNGFIAYGQAKTANILHAVSLTAKLADKGIVSYAVHPGSIWTGLSRHLDAEGEAAVRKTSPVWKTHDQGAATVLVAGFDPALNQPEGVLLHDCQLIEAARHATDPEIAERLWGLSERLVKKEFKL